MMKRILAVLLAAVMLLALCACGGPTEEEARAIELYNKYAGVIDRLEHEDYTGVIQEIAVLINSGKEQEEKTPMAELMVGEWHLADGEEKLNPAQTISVAADGTVTVDGVALTWLEEYSGDESLGGFLLKDGVHTYAMEIVNHRDNQIPYVQLWTVESNGGNFYSDDWMGTYYNDPMLGYLLLSWDNLDNHDEVMDNYISISRRCANVNDTELEWSVISSGEGSITADLGGAYTLAVEVRGEKPIAFLTENATGNQAAYYANYSDKYGYDRSWPEFIYPRAVAYLNECVEEQSENDTPGFWDYTVEEDVSYSGNAAWKRLYEMFTALGDYKDSAEIAGRFTILKDMYTGAENNRVDNMGNESTDREYELVKYNSQGQVTYSETRENFRLYGGYSYGELYFFYDETGRVTKIQRGSGNNVSVVITPAYDDQGRMVSATYQSNDYNHELSYTYDAQGRLIENIVWNGSDRYWHTYTYDAAGNLVKDVYWYGWGSNYQMYRYTVDYTYDAQGYLVKEVKVYESYSDYWDEYTLQKTYTWEYTNDAQGRPVSAQYTELDRDGSTSYASQTITYHYNDLYFFD